jgi:hypothetical protein
MAAPVGVVALVGGVMGRPRSDDGDVCVVTPVGASSLEIHRLDGRVGSLVAWRRSLCVSRVETKVERRVIYHRQ